MHPADLRLLQDRFPWSSWAIWDESFPAADCVEEDPSRLPKFFEANVNRLNPDTVLAGLNRSTEIEHPLQNYHSTSGRHYDDRLKRFVQDAELQQIHGAFMTDLVDEVTPESAAVQMTSEDAGTFEAQLQTLPAVGFKIVCFGRKPFEALTDRYTLEVTELPFEVECGSGQIAGFSVDVYRVWFYGLYGVHQHKVDELREQLRYLNERFRS